MTTSEELNGLMQAVAAAGDRQAFAALFKHFAPRVKNYLMRSGSPDGVAEELVQETMVSVWRKAALFDARHAGASTWVFTLARNLRVDHLRRQGRVWVDDESQDVTGIPDAAPPPDEQLHTLRCERDIRAALSQLPAEQAQVLLLSFYEDHAHARIAEELGLPLGTVKSRIRLAVTHLRRLLDDLAP